MVAPWLGSVAVPNQAPGSAPSVERTGESVENYAVARGARDVTSDGSASRDHRARRAGLAARPRTGRASARHPEGQRESRPDETAVPEQLPPGSTSPTLLPCASRSSYGSSEHWSGGATFPPSGPARHRPEPQNSCGTPGSKYGEP